MIKKYLLLFSLFLPVLLSSCRQQSTASNNRIVIAIPSDAESLNPLFSFSSLEVNITELLYPGLVENEWDESAGNIITKPLIARSWKWSDDSTSVTIQLRDDITWRDGKKLTADDVIFSFDLYSDPDVESRFLGVMNKFYLEKNMHIDLAKTFETLSPYELKINFVKGSAPSLFDIDMPVLPKHVFSSMNRKDLASLEKGNDTITSGAFYLKKWEKNQAITLERNEKSFLNNETKTKQLVFKIVTDYNAKITQLKNGTVDFLDNIKPDQVDELKNAGSLNIAPVKGREYDYAAWNDKKIFSSSAVKKAMTYAINRQEILSGYLNNEGTVASGPIAEIFNSYYNNSIKPLPYDPAKAKEILASEGWVDKNNDGILEKGNLKFSFDLYYGAGNPRREFAATVIKNNLRAVGIEVRTVPMEQGVFFEKMFNRELPAWLGGWSIPIPIDLSPYIHSEAKKGKLNLTGYNNKEIDHLLDIIQSLVSEKEKAEAYKKIGELLYNDPPVTYLYWVDNICAYTNKLKDVKITPLGSLHQCRKWSF